MKCFTNMRKLWSDLKTRLAIARVKRHMAALGYPIDHLSDQELCSAVSAVAAAARLAMVTTDESVAALILCSTLPVLKIEPDDVRDP